MKRTPLFDLHVANGAKLGTYAGWEMPLFYPLGVKAEHLHTRHGAGLFDISHMLHVDVGGADAARFLSHMCPFDATALGIGQCRYTFFLNDRGGIIDDLIITALPGSRFRIVANAGCADKDLAHLKAHAAAFDVTVTVLPVGFLALQGPKAEAALAEVTGISPPQAFMTASEPREGWFVSRTGYTGEDGFEIALPQDELVDLATRLQQLDDVEWVGLAARDSLRLEAGLSLYGQDLDEDITPHEAGLIWAVPRELRDGGPFIGAKALADAISQGRRRKRVGLLADGRPVRAGATLVNTAGEQVGTVTSGGFGPTVDKPIALGLVDMSAADEPLFADLRGTRIAMMPAPLPFVPHRYKR